MGNRRSRAVELTDWVAARDKAVAARFGNVPKPGDKPLTKNHLRYQASIEANPVTLTCGPAGCLHPDTPIHDPTDGTTKTVAERAAAAVPFHVHALDEPSGGLVVTPAEPPREYPAAPMLRFTLKDGRTITVTTGHRFWTGSEYVTAADLSQRLRERGVVRLPTNTGLDRAV